MIAFWVAVAAALVGGWFSALNMSLREMSRGALRELAERRGKLRAVEPIIEHAGRYAHAVSLPRLALNVVVVGASLVWATGAGEGSSVTWPALLAGAGVAALLLYFFGVVAPASVASHVGESLLLRSVWLLRLVYFLMRPVARVAEIADVAVKRLAGVAELSGEEELERELRSVVSEGEEEGRLTELEREIIESVVGLGARTIEEIMTPRTEMEGFASTDDLAYIRDFIEHAGHSRIPVYEGDLDHIAGVLYAKDLLGRLGDDVSDFSLAPMLRRPIFVPETKPILDCLTELRSRKVHLAIVLDEYGGTAGLVTIEDILEEMVGEIHDEHEPPDEAPPEIALDGENRSAELDARATILDANDALERLDVRIPEEDDYDTVGGFVVTSLGRIPRTGEAFRVNGLVVTVLDAQPTRVTRVRIARRDGEDAGGESGRVVELDTGAQTPD